MPHAFDITPVDIARHIVDTTGVDVKKFLGELDGMKQAIHLGIHPDAAAAIARTDKVRVAIPYFCGIQTVPGGLHNFMLRQTLGKRGWCGVC